MDSQKFRQLPCKTYVSSGACPYRERCRYLHDPRLRYQESQFTIRMKSKGDRGMDTLFWPVMTMQNLQMYSNQPHVVQQYNVPHPKFKHEEAIYSIWMHFVEFCHLTSLSERSSKSDINKYTRRKRLHVFVSLSKG